MQSFHPKKKRVSISRRTDGHKSQKLSLVRVSIRLLVVVVVVVGRFKDEKAVVVVVLLGRWTAKKKKTIHGPLSTPSLRVFVFFSTEKLPRRDTSLLWECLELTKMTCVTERAQPIGYSENVQTIDIYSS